MRMFRQVRGADPAEAWRGLLRLPFEVTRLNCLLGVFLVVPVGIAAIDHYVRLDVPLFLVIVLILSPGRRGADVHGDRVHRSSGAAADGGARSRPGSRPYRTAICAPIRVKLLIGVSDDQPRDDGRRCARRQPLRARRPRTCSGDVDRDRCLAGRLRPDRAALAFSLSHPSATCWPRQTGCGNGDFTARVPEVSADEYSELARVVQLRRRGVGTRPTPAADNQRLLDEVRGSRARIVTASDAERRRVERNLHDGAQQRLVALSLDLRMLEERAGDDDARRGCVGRARTCGRRSTSCGSWRGLHPPVWPPMACAGLGSSWPAGRRCPW